MSEEIPVVIDLTSKAVGEDGNAETTTNRVDGILIQKENTLYIRYAEEIEDTGRIRNVVKIAENDVTIIRNGAVSMHQRFQEGETTKGDYGTYFGTLHMETATKRLSSEWKRQEGYGELDLTYQLMLQGRDVGEVTLALKIQEADEA